MPMQKDPYDEPDRKNLTGLEKRSAFARFASFGETASAEDLMCSLPSRSSLMIQASEGWLGVRDGIRNWLVTAA